MSDKRYETMYMYKVTYSMVENRIDIALFTSKQDAENFVETIEPDCYFAILNVWRWEVKVEL